MYSSEKDVLREVGYPGEQADQWMTSKTAVGDVFETATLYMRVQGHPKGIASLVAYAWEAWEKHSALDKCPTPLANLIFLSTIRLVSGLLRCLPGLVRSNLENMLIAS